MAFIHKVLVIGLGVSGRAATQLLLKRGCLVVGVDRQWEKLQSDPEIQSLISQGMELKCDQIHDILSDIDLVVVSPGVPSTHRLVSDAKTAGINVIGEIELACCLCFNRMIGITGTNGKTTVTMLTAHVLNACGLMAKAVGNIGTPLSAEVLDADPRMIFVIELSSYQLETMRNAFLDAGVILNITPDHLDRYRNMHEYAAAKALMANVVKPDAPLYVEETIPKQYPGLLKHRPAFTYGYAKANPISTDLTAVYDQGAPVFVLPNALRRRRSHDIENLLAAFALCSQMGITGPEFAEAYDSFTKPPHRIQFITQKHGIRFYDDSKGTNIDAVIRAVESVEGPIVLIAGGVDKGASYTPWIQAFKDKVKCVCVLGQAAAKIEEEISHSIPVMSSKCMEHAVEQAMKVAKDGDAVLLSPGCSSFDMFRDYAHRGEEFQRIVIGKK